MEQPQNQPSQKLEATFSTLVISIASSAVVSLGIEKNPQTNQYEKNPDLAQYSIDLLVMLRDKTRNNLTEPERNYLDAIVQDLQLKFVQSK